MPTSRTETLLITAPGVPESGGVKDLLDELVKATTAQSGVGADATQLALELRQLSATGQAQAEAVSENTKAILDNTVAQVLSKENSTLSNAGNAVWNVFKTGLVLSPVVTGLMRLFGGGGQEEPLPELPVYTRPPSIQYEATLGVRPATAERPQTSPPAESRGTQVTIQVQAMDSRSFLDHSDEIARAVREAMLNSHSLNDVVSEI